MPTDDEQTKDNATDDTVGGDPGHGNKEKGKEEVVGPGKTDPALSPSKEDPVPSEDVAKLSEVVRKEREARKAAERELAELKKGSMTVEERIAKLEATNKEQALQIKRDALVKDLVSQAPSGHKVDVDSVSEMLSMVNLTDDNVEDNVKRIVKLCTRPDTALDVPDNKQPRSDTYDIKDAMELQISDVFGDKP